jgi:hypothetical protein
MVNPRVSGIFCVTIAMTCALAAQNSSNADWVGVWQGELNGQPSVILTLAQDNGPLEGTVVLNGIRQEAGQAPHIVVRQSHVLMHPRIDGNTLSFQLKRAHGSDPLMDFTVTRADGGNAVIHCSNCGKDAPVAPITKQD